MAKTNLKSQYEKITATIIQAVTESTVIDYIYDVLQDAIEQIVYEAYKGSYQRRHNVGGLADKKFFDFTVDKVSDNKMIINVYTNVKTNGRNKSDYLDKIIVEGDSYDWENSEIYKMQPFPRDFYEYAENELRSDPTFKKLLADSLKKKGITLK